MCPSNTFSEVPSFNFGQGTNFNPINDGYSQPGGSRQENSSLLYEQHQALIFADPLEKSAQMECSLIFREREREIEKVSDGVLQVVELLQSMHTTVVEQGTLLDRIDYNLDEASHLVSQAVVHIGRRNDRQKKFTFRHLTLLVIVLLILSVIIAIAIKLKM